MSIFYLILQTIKPLISLCEKDGTVPFCGREVFDHRLIAHRNSLNDGDGKWQYGSERRVGLFGKLGRNG